ncbi:MAG: hypothetical protein K8S55_14700, partial [Phycisphaerae bacterium]|nr:hypothetical protein [Phycisphaerae bacterium]
MTREKKRVIIEVLVVIAVVVFLNIISRYKFAWGPIPELSDEEVSAILDAYQLPAIPIVAIHVVFSCDDGIDMAARIRINRSQLNKVVQESWM